MNNPYDIKTMQMELAGIKDANLADKIAPLIDSKIREEFGHAILYGYGDKNENKKLNLVEDIGISGLNIFDKKKVDSHGRVRYGIPVVCEKCGAKGTTLFNINGIKICKKCKEEDDKSK